MSDVLASTLLPKTAADVIPPITDPRGRYWDQPRREDISISSRFAKMSFATFNKLSRYHQTTPSGVYEGKMWASVSGSSAFLIWYGCRDESDKCSINMRKILFIREIDSVLCPGCKHAHRVVVGGPNDWQWNLSYDRPTLTPSILVTMPPINYRCHSYVRDGLIHFLPDCTHELAGKTIELPDWDDEDHQEKQ